MANKLPSKSYARIQVDLPLPDLIEVQIESFERLKKEGLADLFHEISPIESYNKGMKLYFPSRMKESEDWKLTYWFGEPKHSLEECVERDLTYASPLYVSVLLAGPEIPDPIKQDIFLGDFPEMTEKGTFIVNGTERVVVSQLIRSPGVYFEAPMDRATGRPLAISKLIPDRGAWMEFETRKSDYLTLRFNRKRTVPVTIFLRALAAVNDGLADSPLKEGTDAEILALFQDIDNNPDRMFIASTFAQEPAWDTTHGVSLAEQALLEFFKRMRPGDPATLDNAREFLEEQLFDQRHYDLERVGRYKLNQKLELHPIIPITHRMITKWDIVRLVRRMIMINNGVVMPDDIDHLGNRRAKTVGELIQNKLRIGLRRMERVIKERMSIRDQDQLTPITLINIRPVVAALREFFGSSQLSQFMDQTNPLAEMTHKRRLSALGPGGLSRERAGFEVRDVHYTHYGRLCPIETPEGPNIGLISSLCVYAKINELGFIETPYRDVSESKVNLNNEEVKWLTAEDEEFLTVAQANAPLNPDGTFTNPRAKSRLGADYPFEEVSKVQMMDVAPNQIASIAASLIPFLEHDDANRALMGSNMMRQAVPLVKPEAPIVGTGLEAQVIKDSRILIVAEGDGVVEYVDANEIVIRYIRSDEEKFVSFDDDIKRYVLPKYHKTNQNTTINLVPIVRKGEKVVKGQVLTEGYGTKNGELALGRNLKVAFMPWKGYNFEDAIVISEKVVQEDIFTSVHIDEYILEVRDTKRGMEELTSDIPNVSEEATRNLDENGLIRIGAQIKPGDILIGKITPKGESDPSPEEKLLRAIFGDKAGDVKDASLKAGPSLEGVVINKKLFTRAVKDRKSKTVEKPLIDKIDADFNRASDDLKARLVDKLFILVNGKTSQGVKDYLNVDIIPKGAKFTLKQLQEIDYLNVNPNKWTTDKKKNDSIKQLLHNYIIKFKEVDGIYKRKRYNITIGDELPAGIVRLAKVYLAKKRKVRVGDKMAGRHGNKGIVAKIVRQEDMPFLADGTPVDIVLNPLGVPSRMNLGQIYESVLGWAGKELGMQFSTPIFDGASQDEINGLTEKAGVPRNGTTYLYDGGTGERFDQPATVGMIYMLKLGHMVDDKMHARSIGPYSLITQQPLGGKAQFGGQRFGEMEVWALEAFGAAHILQEILTIKSDDVIGRAKAYEAIVKGEPMPMPGIPESLNVLLHELRGLGLSINLE